MIESAGLKSRFNRKIYNIRYNFSERRKNLEQLHANLASSERARIKLTGQKSNIIRLSKMRSAAKNGLRQLLEMSQRDEQLKIPREVVAQSVFLIINAGLLISRIRQLSTFRPFIQEEDLSIEEISHQTGIHIDKD